MTSGSTTGAERQRAQHSTTGIAVGLMLAIPLWLLLAIAAYSVWSWL